MKTILNFTEFNEGFISNIKSGIRKGVSLVKNLKNWIDKLFKHPNARPLKVEGGKGVEFIIKGQSVVKIYDWTENFKQNEASINEDVVPLRWEGQENVDDDELDFLVETLFRHHGNIFIFGTYGIGKTRIVERFCKDNGLMMELIILTLRDPVDLLGILMPQEGTKYSESRLPNIWPQSNWPGKIPEGKTEEDGPGGIIFFDELNRAHETVRSAALSFIGDRKIGTLYTLPSNWTFVSASNRKIDDDGVEDLGRALVGRFEIVNFAPNVGDWIEKAEEFGKLHQDVVDFVRNNPQYYHYLDLKLDPDLPYASPRSWSKASKYYKIWLDYREKHQDFSYDKMRRRLTILMTPVLGMTVGTEFVDYIYSKEEIQWDKIKLITTEPNEVPLPPKGANNEYDAGIAIKIVENILAHLKDITLDEKILKNIDIYLDRLGNFELSNSFLSKLNKDHEYIFDEGNEKLFDLYTKMYEKNKEYYALDDKKTTN